MNRQTRNQLRTALIPLLSSRSEHVRLECAKVLCAIEGIWCGDSGIYTPSSVTAKVALAKQQVYQRMEAKREKRKKQNRRAYLKRKIQVLKQEQQTQQEAQQDT
jgi:hypothetical protein